MKNLVLFIISVSLSISLQAMDAKQIMKTTQQKTSLNGLEAISSLIIKDAKDRTRTRKTAMVSKAYPNKIEKRLIRFIDPPDVKGMSMLIIDKEFQDDDMWIYIPANRQSRRIISREKSKSFMGSEFSNADMTAPNLNDFLCSLLGEENIESQQCWKIELRPITETKQDEYGFSRKISWVNQQDTMLIKSEYFDFDNELFKVLKVEKYSPLDEQKSKFIVSNMNIINIQNGRSSQMIIEKALNNPDIPDTYFSINYLETP